MLVDGLTVILPRWLIDEVLEKRLGQGIKLDELFLLLPYEEDHDSTIETKFGKLKVFFCKQYQGNPIILCTRKYKHPTKHTITGVGGLIQ